MTLVRDDNRLSEQTFGVGITVTDPIGQVTPATLETANTAVSYDYRVADGSVGQTFFVVQFPPQLESFAFGFFLNSDQLPEGLEGFQVSSSTVQGFPSFQPPLLTSATAFQFAQILIKDDDCESHRNN